MNSDVLTTIIGGVIIFLVAVIIMLNVTFVQGYSRGYARGKEESTVIYQKVEVGEYIRELMNNIDGDGSGPMYNKPNIESNGRIGW